MVVYYQIAGKKVGSHFVRLPACGSYLPVHLSSTSLSANLCG